MITVKPFFDYRLTKSIGLTKCLMREERWTLEMSGVHLN